MLPAVTLADSQHDTYPGIQASARNPQHYSDSRSRRQREQPPCKAFSRFAMPHPLFAMPLRTRPVVLGWSRSGLDAPKW